MFFEIRSGREGNAATVIASASLLTINLFGPMQVLVEGHPLPRLRSRKALWLLALLILRGERPVERAWLAGTLWPDVAQSRAASNLRVVLSELRHALGDEGRRLLSPGRHTLSLDAAGAEIDVRAFDAAVKIGQRPALELAAALYRGPLLEGCDEEWVGQERNVREQSCLQALHILADAALETGDGEAAARYYRQTMGLDPWQEAAQRGLMQALSRSGDTNAALDVYQTFVRFLRKDDPRAFPDAQTTALYTRLRAAARRRAAPPPATAAEDAAPPVVTGYLPHPLTDLVGREDERDDVSFLLQRSRLVTLTGPGGIGKTRLALVVAGEAVEDYSDGVWLVALEALVEGIQVVPQVADVLGLREEAGRTLLESLTDHLRPKRLLLVLDNCEHLLDASAHMMRHLLQECAGLRVLATSREALGITGEAVWSVPALSVPDPAHLPPGPATLLRVVVGFEGVQLFAERAQAVQKTFVLTRDNASAVAQICARLEGIPLALELAAAWVRALTIEQIALRLDNHLGLLTGSSRGGMPRQQTLRATLDWSYALLSVSEQLLLARVSAFSGGWSLEAAEAICSEQGIQAGQVVALLTALVDKSLVIFEKEEVGVGGRYRLLETVRQYAAERLLANGATDQVRSRHRDWFAALAAEAYIGLRGAEQVVWLRRLERERENHRAALGWIGSELAGVEVCLQMAATLWWFWYVRGYLSEGKQLLDRVLHREGAQQPTPVRARALNGAGTLSAVTGDFEAARTLLEESLSIFQAVDDVKSRASVLGNLGNIAVFQGEYGLARERYAESLEITREIGEPQQTAASLGNLAEIALAQSDYDSGWRLETEALEIFRELRDKHGTARTLHGLGSIAYYQADYTNSQVLQEEALALFQELQEQRGMSDTMSGLGNIEVQRGHAAAALSRYRESLILRRDTGLKSGIESSLREFAGLLLRCREPRKAVRLWSSAEALRVMLGSRLPPNMQHLLEGDIATARVALGEAEFAAAQAEGRALTWEQATADALGDGREDAAMPPMHPFDISNDRSVKQ